MSIQTVSTWFNNSFKTYSSSLAVSFFRDGKCETQITYSDLQKDVNQFANYLSQFQLEKGDRVALLLEKAVIQAVAHIALLQTGIIAVPLNSGFKKYELEYLLKDADPALVIVDNDKAQMIKQIDSKINILEIPTGKPYQEIDFFRSCDFSVQSRKVSQDDPGLIIYTSGTTGSPKGAVLTHGNLVCDAENIISVWNISQNDVLCHALPLFHVHGLCFALHTALFSGSHVIMLDRFSPDTVAQILSSKQLPCRCTVFMAVPAMYTKLLDLIEDKQIDFSHIRLLTSGSAPLLEKEFNRIRNVFGQNPVEREGMSETGMNFSNPVNGRKVPGSIGRPLPGVCARIVDPETKKDVAPCQTGEIWLKSPCIAKEYWKKPVETSSAFEKQWFKTGDLGKKDNQGYYYLTDRIKHMIITGGENVSPKQVETIINEIKGVRQSSVVGIPDKRWGEKIVALVEKLPETELSESMIQSVCREKLINLKCPKKIVFTHNIPKNSMGKILKERVKQFF